MTLNVLGSGGIKVIPVDLFEAHIMITSSIHDVEKLNVGRISETEFICTFYYDSHNSLIMLPRTEHLSHLVNIKFEKICIVFMLLW